MPDLEQIVGSGYQLFQKYLPELLKHYRGKVVAIDEKSGDYFVGKDGNEAIKKAERKYPGRVFYLAIVPKHPELPRCLSPRYVDS